MKTRHVLITGVSSGIGLAAAKALVKKGYSVIGTYRKEEDRPRLLNLGIQLVHVDLDNTAECEQAVNDILRITNHHLYAIVNNAGFGVYGALSTVNRQQLMQQFSTNLFAVHQLTMGVLPAMLSHGQGRIIQLSSIMGFISTPGRGVYAASKHALEAWSDALRLELYGSGLFVSLIEPGPVKTAFNQNVKQTNQDKQVNNPPIATLFTLQPDVVVSAIVHALESTTPKRRYRLSLMTKVMAVLKRLLPVCLMDSILRSK